MHRGGIGEAGDLGRCHGTSLYLGVVPGDDRGHTGMLTASQGVTLLHPGEVAGLAEIIIYSDGTSTGTVLEAVVDNRDGSEV
jgi:hypothetical protein